MSTAVKSAVVYACEPDATASIAALDYLVGAAEKQGYAVRAAVADTASRCVPLDERPGWRKLVPLLADPARDQLLVQSRTRLGWDDAHRARALDLLYEWKVQVRAMTPAPWEITDWLYAWTHPDGIADDAEPVTATEQAMCCAVFPALEANVRAARELASKALRSWETLLTGVDIDMVVLAVSELVTNAIIHGSRPGDPVAVSVERGERTLRVSVEDRSLALPCPRAAGDGGGLRARVGPHHGDRRPLGSHPAHRRHRQTGVAAQPPPRSKPKPSPDRRCLTRPTINIAHCSGSFCYGLSSVLGRAGTASAPYRARLPWPSWGLVTPRRRIDPWSSSVTHAPTPRVCRGGVHR
ncbi:ATP-binding protein [Streptomyces sp. NPDC005953]|uniref:ATP-binding protein n=1 Tax=Streptomyces sp. NPDC005953 TaxID=3156719 RepID=UPI0033F1772C